MEVISLLSLLIPLILTILKEFFSAKARARQRNEKFELDKKAFLEFANKALVKLREDTARDNGRIGDVDDEVERDVGKK